MPSRYWIRVVLSATYFFVKKIFTLLRSNLFCSFLLTATRRVPHVNQDMLTFPGYQSSSLVFVGLVLLNL